MKKSDWMSEAGYRSGERAERLEQERLRARSPMEVIADEFAAVFIAILLAGGAMGAVVGVDVVRPVVEALSGSDHAAYSLSGLWSALMTHAGGFVLGLMCAFLAIDVPLTMIVVWLRKKRPELFLPRR